MKVAFIPKRENAKKSEESIGCHSHNYFGHTGVRRVGQQLSVAAAEQSHALKHCGIQKSWDNNTLGITFSSSWGRADVATSGGHCLPPQCSPQPSSLAALLHLLTSTHCPCKSLFSLRSSILGPHTTTTTTTEQLSSKTCTTHSPQHFAYLSPSRSAQGGILSARSRKSKKTIFAGDQRN